MGYNGSHHKIFYAGKTQITSEAGTNIRLDRTDNSELSRTKDRTIATARLLPGDIAEDNLAVYISETVAFSPLFSMNAGLRYDYFHNRYPDKLHDDMTQKDSASI